MVSWGLECAVNQWNIVRYAESHFDGVAALWQEAFPNPQPWNAPEVTIPAKLAMQQDLFLVAMDDGDRIIGSVLAGYDGHRGWLYAVAVLKAHQRRGWVPRSSVKPNGACWNWAA